MQFWHEIKLNLFNKIAKSFDKLYVKKGLAEKRDIFHYFIVATLSGCSLGFISFSFSFCVYCHITPLIFRYTTKETWRSKYFRVNWLIKFTTH